MKHHKIPQHAPVKELSEKQFRRKYTHCKRVGKTHRDHKSGAWSRRRDNQQARAEYVQWCSSSSSATATTQAASAKFPLARCNGQKSRALKK